MKVVVVVFNEDHTMYSHDNSLLRKISSHTLQGIQLLSACAFGNNPAATGFASSGISDVLEVTSFLYDEECATAPQ